MITLIVTPIDYNAPGSYRLRRRVMVASKQMGVASETKDGAAAIDAALQIDDILVARVRTEDGSPLEDALDEISANDFDDLLSALVESPVPTESASSSENGEPEQET